jgi:hypothetical protein
MAPRYLIAVALGLSFANPARSADLKKYLPNDASAYIHINVKQLFTAPVIRKAVPMAFDKYGDQIMPLVQMAKAFNPNTPDIPEAQVKKGIEELKKEETIAKGFDVAKDVVTDIIISGDANDDEGKSFVILIKAPEQVTGDAVEAGIKMVPQDQVKIKQHKSGKSSIYEVQVPQAMATAFLTIPEPGVIVVTMSKEGCEKAIEQSAGKGDAKVNADLTKLISDRNTNDFVFFAGIKGKGDDKEVTVGKLLLDKDIAGKMKATFATEEKAKKEGDELKSNLENALEKVKEMLGDKKDLIKAITDKTKTQVDGKTVSGEFAIPGSVIEKLLAKDS